MGQELGSIGSELRDKMAAQKQECLCELHLAWEGRGPERAQAAVSRGLRPRAGPPRLGICEPRETALARPPFHSTRGRFGPRTRSRAGRAWRVKGLLERELSLRLKASKDPRPSRCPGSPDALPPGPETGRDARREGSICAG